MGVVERINSSLSTGKQRNRTLPGTNAQQETLPTRLFEHYHVKETRSEKKKGKLWNLCGRVALSSSSWHNKDNTRNLGKIVRSIAIT